MSNQSFTAVEGKENRFFKIMIIKMIVNINNPRYRIQPPPLRAHPLPGPGGPLPPHQRHHPPQADPQTQAVVPRQPGPQCPPGYVIIIISKPSHHIMHLLTACVSVSNIIYGTTQLSLPFIYVSKSQ